MDSVAFQVWAGLCFLVHLAVCSPITSLDVPLLQEEMPFFDEQDTLLENWQNELLKALNLSDVPLQEQAKVDPPEYMLELYNRFATNKASMPSANIVRSFKNEELTSLPIHSHGIRRYPLLFNVSIPHHEKITMAELRLYTLVEEDRMLYEGLDRKVTIFEVLEHEHGGGREEEETRLRVLASRHLHSTDNEWKTFEVTDAIRKWQHSGSTTHRLEVRIENRGREGPSRGGKVEIDINSETKHKPLLIVFSDDQNHAKREERRELKEMIEHEETQDLQTLGLDDFHSSPSQGKLLHIRSNIIYDSTSRIRRNAKGGNCKRTSLHVDFKEIGWDSWIIQPVEYDAYQCKGACSFPLDDHLTTTHAMARTLVHLKFPQRASPACCVPTKLAPISLLYLEKGVVTFKLNYEGMSVLECGCR
ncbi:bone morphogenetic protein 10 [Hemicordylus capensis]|uniref:bone morphogenetic protein 10 n=1 Tax=Hemicordylus capensis TaxID=884348 RepID=UPI0023029770|nr:bone morphogenetic protein 10 [Hemicordylus capensis]